MIRVLVVDDEGLVRAGFRALVESADDLCVVGEAANGIQAVRMAGATSPDVVLMDLRMPTMDGLEATQLVADRAPGSRVLIVTTFDDDEYVFAAMRAGASGFILKDTPPEQPLEAIRVIAGGEALLAPSVTRRLIAEFSRTGARPPAVTGTLDQLTDREREVLEQVAAGLSNAEIAHVLVVSMATVKTHVSRLLAKLDARDRAGLVIAAYDNGVVSPRR